MNKPKVALISYDAMGDGLFYLMMAYNLQINGYDVTYYSSAMKQLESWVPSIKIKTLKGIEDIESAKAANDLVLLDPPSFMRGILNKKEYNKDTEKYVLLNQRLPKIYRKDLSHLYENPKLKQIAISGAFRNETTDKENIVDLYLKFMNETMNLDKLEKNINLTIPKNLIKNKYPNRIPIFPRSPYEGKNWSASGFIKVFNELEKNGMKPEIILSPQDKVIWDKLSNNFPCKADFNSLSDLASYLYESGVVFSNDSGGGHLASFLGISSVTVYQKADNKFNLRPGWAENFVATPFFSFKLFKKRVWRPFVSSKKIVNKILEYRNKLKT